MLNSGVNQAASVWTRGTATFDAGGAVAFSGATGPGGALTLTGYTVAVGAGGTLTRGDLASYGGQLSLSKELLVRTQTSGNNNRGLFVRR